MDDAAATDLESAIAAAGALLVELQKYRAGVTQHHELLAEAMRLGDEARAGHHRQALDGPTAIGLRRAVTALHARIASALGAIRQGADYRDAVAAQAAGDASAMRRLLPAVFEGLEPVEGPVDGHLAVTWIRRNRPRPAAELAAEVARLRREGVTAEGSTDAPGVDPMLPAVVLAAAPPPGEPLLLRFPAERLPHPVFRVAPSGELLVHTTVLRAPFGVVVPRVLDLDEVGEIDLDWEPYRTALVAALVVAGEAVEAG